MKIVSVFVHSREGLWVRNFRKREALGGGLDINYKRGRGNGKKKSQKKAAIFFFFGQTEPFGSVWLVLHVLNLGLLCLRKSSNHLESKGATDL